MNSMKHLRDRRFLTEALLVMLLTALMVSLAGANMDQQYNALRRVAPQDPNWLPHSTGLSQNAIVQVPNLPLSAPQVRFRSPCRGSPKCGKVMKRQIVPRIAQLENIIMSVFRDMMREHPGSRVPDKLTNTEPEKLLLDGMYKENLCTDKLENCLKEEKRRRRVLRKILFKKFNNMRNELIAYGGRRLWGGEANLFYR